MDDLDPEAQIERLLAAARRETPSPHAKQRALAHARLGRGSARAAAISARGWLLAALATGIFGAIWLLREAPPRRVIRAELVQARAARRVPVETRAEPSLPKTQDTTLAHHEISSRTKREPTPNKLRTITLEAELVMLDGVRQTLLQGKAEEALALLNDYERQPGQRRLGAEAALLRIQILAANSRPQEASALAKRFVTDHPDSPLAERAKSFVTVPSQSVPNQGESP